MLLLNEAIETLKAKASSVTMASNGEFDVGQGAKSESDNKKNWMNSAQLWISNSNSTNEEEDRCVTPTPFQTCNNLNQGGAFLPFNPHPPPDPLSLMTPTSDMMMDCSRIEQNHQLNRPIQSHHHIQKKGREGDGHWIFTVSSLMLFRGLEGHKWQPQSRLEI